MFLINAVLIIILAASLWVALVPNPPQTDDHLGLAVGNDHVGPGLFIAIVCTLALMLLN